MKIDISFPRELAWGGVTSVAVLAAANAFKQIGPRIGFGAMGLGAAANAVGMAVGVPVAAGYVATFAIDGSRGIDNYEHFLTNPQDMLFNTVLSAAIVYEHYSNDPFRSVGQFDPTEFEVITPGIL